MTVGTVPTVLAPSSREEHPGAVESEALAGKRIRPALPAFGSPVSAPPKKKTTADASKSIKFSCISSKRALLAFMFEVKGTPVEVYYGGGAVGAAWYTGTMFSSRAAAEQAFPADVRKWSATHPKDRDKPVAVFPDGCFALDCPTPGLGAIHILLQPGLSGGSASVAAVAVAAVAASVGNNDGDNGSGGLFSDAAGVRPGSALLAAALPQSTMSGAAIDGGNAAAAISAPAPALAPGAVSSGAEALGALPPAAAAALTLSAALAATTVKFHRKAILEALGACNAFEKANVLVTPNRALLVWTNVEMKHGPEGTQLWAALKTAIDASTVSLGQQVESLFSLQLKQAAAYEAKARAAGWKLPLA